MTGQPTTVRQRLPENCPVRQSQQFQRVTGRGGDICGDLYIPDEWIDSLMTGEMTRAEKWDKELNEEAGR